LCGAAFDPIARHATTNCAGPLDKFGRSAGVQHWGEPTTKGIRP
jgi:hypothetical protein